MATGNSNIPQSPTHPTLVPTASISDSTLQPPPPPSSSNSPNLYPEIETNHHEEKTVPDYAPSAPPECFEETVLTIRGAIIHLIDKQCSVELATGDLSILQLRQGNNTLAVFARVADEIQWPLTKDLAAVKLDDCHYFFSFPSPKEIDSDSDSDSSSDEEINEKHKKKVQNEKKSLKAAAAGAEKVAPPLDVLNYGLTIASKGQETLLNEFDKILENSSSFSVHKLKNDIVKELLGGESTNEMSPEDLNVEGKKEILEGKCAAYWTTLAPNVEEYSGAAAKLVAMGSGQLIKGILWCGDVAVDRLKWGNETLKKKLASGSNAEISPETLKRIKRVKRITRMTENVATGVLSGVIAVSGYFTGTVVNSSVGKKFFNLLPGEVVLASLDGFSKICDAVEVAGKNVMSTSSTVTTGLVSHRYGEEAARATSEGLDAAGHAIGTAWAAFKIRKAFNPKNALKPGTLTKAAAKAAEKKTKTSK